jgi:hypothetical protein
VVWALAEMNDNKRKLISKQCAVKSTKMTLQKLKTLRLTYTEETEISLIQCIVDNKAA